MKRPYPETGLLTQSGPRRARRNAPNDPPSVQEVIAIASDMVKEGKIPAAEKMLVEQAGLKDNAIAGVLFSAIADKLREGGKAARAEAGKLFRKVRPKYRTYKIPSRLHTFVTFTEQNVRLDIAIAEGFYEPTDRMEEDFGEREDDIEVELQVREIDQWNETVFEVIEERSEWIVARNDDVAEKIAIAQVTQDLEDSPEMFNQGWLEDYVDQEALAKLVYEMAMDDDYLDEVAKEDASQFWDMAQSEGIDIPEENEDGDLPDDVDQKYIDELKEKMAVDNSRRPMSYLTDMMSEAEARVFVRDRVGIDVEAAAKAAVAEDGIGHFLSSYDGETNETVSGFCYWRTS